MTLQSRLKKFNFLRILKFNREKKYNQQGSLWNKIRKIDKKKIQNCFPKNQSHQNIDVLHHQTFVPQLYNICVHNLHGEIRSVRRNNGKDDGNNERDDEPGPKFHPDHKKSFNNIPSGLFLHILSKMLCKNKEFWRDEAESKIEFWYDIDCPSKIITYINQK